MADFAKSVAVIKGLPWPWAAGVVGAAFVAATVTSLVIGHFVLAGGPTKPPGAGEPGAEGQGFNVPSPAASLNQAALDQILKRNIFNSDGEAEGPSPAEPESSDVQVEAVKSDLPVKLLGTIYGGDPLSGIAMVENTQKKTINSFLVGDQLTKEAVVKEIHKERVILDRSGRLEYIEVDKPTLTRSRRQKRAGPAGGQTPAIAPIATEPPPSTYKEDGFERDKSVIVMTQPYKQKLLTEDFTKVLQDAKASPHMVDGELRGFVLTRIRKDSIYEKAGLQNDDIVEEINGVALTDTSQAIKLLQSLRNESEIEVRVVRGGAPVKFTITIR